MFPGLSGDFLGSGLLLKMGLLMGSLQGSVQVLVRVSFFHGCLLPPTQEHLHLSSNQGFVQALLLVSAIRV